MPKRHKDAAVPKGDDTRETQGLDRLFGSLRIAAGSCCSGAGGAGSTGEEVNRHSGVNAESSRVSEDGVQRSAHAADGPEPASVQEEGSE